jgi:hypothetical protein
MYRRLFSLSASLAASVLAGSPVFGQSASAYRPLTPSDAPYIYQAGYGVYNVDSANARNITANFATITTAQSTTTWSFTANGYNNGGTITCTAYAIKLSGAFPLASGSAGNTSTGAFSNLIFQVAVSSPGTYAVSSVCSLPPSNSSGNATIFGVYP